MRNNEKTLRQKQIWVQKSLKEFDVELAEKKAVIQKQIKEEVASRKMQEQKDREQMGYMLYRIKDEKRKADFERAKKQSDYNVLKEALKDPIQRKKKEMEILQELHAAINWKGTKLQNVGETPEPVVQIIDKFTKGADNLPETNAQLQGTTISSTQ